MPKRSDPKTPEEAAKQMEEWMRVAKPNTGAMVASEYGVVLFGCRGQFDLHETVVAVPLPFLMQLCGAFIQQGVAPLMAAMPVRKFGDPPIVAPQPPSKGA